MPAFFFHLDDADGRSVDPDGVELRDADRARVVAVEAARDIMCSDIRDGTLDLNASITIEDEWGQEIGVIRFADALKIVGEPAL